jgi:hypothetical protein
MRCKVRDVSHLTEPLVGKHSLAPDIANVYDDREKARRANNVGDDVESAM